MVSASSRHLRGWRLGLHTLAIALLAACCTQPAAAFYEGSDVVTLTESNFANKIKSGGVWLVEVRHAVVSRMPRGCNAMLSSVCAACSVWRVFARVAQHCKHRVPAGVLKGGCCSAQRRRQPGLNTHCASRGVRRPTCVCAIRPPTRTWTRPTAAVLRALVWALSGAEAGMAAGRNGPQG
jgi:hypothetical protein